MNLNDFSTSTEEIKILILFEYQSSLLKILENRYLTQDVRRDFEMKLLNVSEKIEEELDIAKADPKEEEA